jgi:hypothetical protein
VHVARAVGSVLTRLLKSPETRTVVPALCQLERLEQRLMLTSVTFEYFVGWWYWCPQFYTYTLGPAVPCESMGTAYQGAYADKRPTRLCDG